MALGAITVLDRVASVGPVTKTRIVMLGDSAYTAGGSYGFEAAFQAAVGRAEKVDDVRAAGQVGDFLPKWNSPLPARSVVCDPATNKFTMSDGSAHGFKAGDAVEFGGTAVPAGLVAGTRYYVIATGMTKSVFEVSATVGGGSVDETTAGTAVTVERKGALFMQVISSAAENGTADLSGVNFELIVDSH